ncbi:hypothetical protein JW848_07985 [Candidatus Bipolaricaulota bacterium]|nr:hypothetical protein [Candidatus Bipolaricaulota bacterium]
MTNENDIREGWVRRMLFHGMRLIPLGVAVGLAIGFAFSDPWIGLAIGAGFGAVWTVIFGLQTRSR